MKRVSALGERLPVRGVLGLSRAQPLQYGRRIHGFEKTAIGKILRKGGQLHGRPIVMTGIESDLHGAGADLRIGRILRIRFFNCKRPS